MRAEYQVEPKAGELLREHHMPSRLRYYPSLTPRTPHNCAPTGLVSQFLGVAYNLSPTPYPFLWRTKG